VIPALFSGFAPWSLLLIPVAIQAWRDRQDLRTSPRLLPLLWLGLILVFFALAAGKRAAYLLPVYPAAALLCGAVWNDLADASVRLPVAVERALFPLGVMVSLLVLLFVAALVEEASFLTPLDVLRPLLHPRDQANLVLVREVIRADPRLVFGFAFVATPLAILLVPAVWWRRWGMVLGIVAAFVVSVSTVATRVIQPRLEGPRSFKFFMAGVRDAVPPGETVVFYRHFDYGAVFYWGDRIPVREDVLTPRADGGTRYVLVWQRDWEALPDEAKASMDALLSSTPARDDQWGRLLLVRVAGASQGALEGG
jgi:hypothetical protein